MLPLTTILALISLIIILPLAAAYVLTLQPPVSFWQRARQAAFPLGGGAAGAALGMAGALWLAPLPLALSLGLIGMMLCAGAIVGYALHMVTARTALPTPHMLSLSQRHVRHHHPAA